MHDNSPIEYAKLFNTGTDEALKALPGYEVLAAAIKLRAYNDIDQDKFLDVALQGLERANSNNNKLEELNYIHDIGWHYYKTGEFDEAFMYYAQGFATSKSLKSKENLSRFNNRIGEIYIRKTNYEKALKYFFKVLQEDEWLRNESYYNLATMYLKEEELETAFEYLDLAFRSNKKQQKFDLVALNLVGIGDANVAVGNYKESLKFYASSLQVTYIYPYPYSEVLAVMGSANAIFKLEHAELSRFLYNYANQVCESFGFKFLYAKNLISIGKTYRKEGNPDQAIEVLHQAQNFAKDHGYEIIDLEALEEERWINEDLGRHDRANEILSVISSMKINLTKQQMEEKLAEWIEENEKELEFLRMKAKALEQQNDDLNQYQKVISHDIRQPLRNVGSFASLLKRRYGDKLDGEANEYIDFILDGAFRMDELLTTLFAYVTLGTEEAVLEGLDLSLVLKDVLKDLEPTIKETKAVVKLDKLPTVLGQRELLYTVFYHLIDNAIKFRGDQRPEIELKVKYSKGEYHFSIADNGIGIHSDYHDKIFLLFTQLDVDTINGTGAGLPMSKKIVLMHGGSIWLKSTPGKGTTIFFTLKEV